MVGFGGVTNKWPERPRCGGSRLENGSGSGEDTGRALVRDFLLGLEPVLNSYVEHNITMAPGRANGRGCLCREFSIPETTSSTWCGSVGRVSVSE